MEMLGQLVVSIFVKVYNANEMNQSATKTLLLLKKSLMALNSKTN